MAVALLAVALLSDQPSIDNFVFYINYMPTEIKQYIYKLTLKERKNYEEKTWKDVHKKIKDAYEIINSSREFRFLMCPECLAQIGGQSMLDDWSEYHYIYDKYPIKIINKIWKYCYCALSLELEHFYLNNQLPLICHCYADFGIHLNEEDEEDDEISE